MGYMLYYSMNRLKETNRVDLLIERETKEAWIRLAKERGISLTELIKRAIEAYAKPKESNKVTPPASFQDRMWSRVLN